MEIIFGFFIIMFFVMILAWVVKMFTAVTIAANNTIKNSTTQPTAPAANRDGTIDCENWCGGTVKPGQVCKTCGHRDGDEI